MNRITTFGLAHGVALVFAFASPGASQAQVKIGMGGPITGPSAATGAQMKNGVDQAAADINAAGGILGKKIVLSYGDDVSDPKQGVSVANNFAGQGVKFVVGHYNSGVTMPASEVYQENGIIEISPASTNPQVTERGMWNIFRNCETLRRKDHDRVSHPQKAPAEEGHLARRQDRRPRWDLRFRSALRHKPQLQSNRSG